MPIRHLQNVRVGDVELMLSNARFALGRLDRHTALLSFVCKRMRKVMKQGDHVRYTGKGEHGEYEQAHAIDKILWTDCQLASDLATCTHSIGTQYLEHFARARVERLFARRL